MVSLDDGHTHEERGEHDLWAEITTTDEDEHSTARVRNTHDIVIGSPSWMPGKSDGVPSAGDYFLVAIAGCHAGVVKNCLEKAGIDDYEIRLEIDQNLVGLDAVPDEYPEYIKYRYPSFTLDVTVVTTEEFRGRVSRCLDVCEDACVMGQSVEEGIELEFTKKVKVTGSS